MEFTGLPGRFHHWVLDREAVEVKAFEWIIHLISCLPTLLLQMYDRAISAPASPTRMSQSGKRSWEEPSWLGSSSRLLNQDMKTNISRSLQTLPTDSSDFDIGEGHPVTLTQLLT